MTNDFKNIITSLLGSKALKDVMTTSQVVVFLDSSKYHRSKLYSAELREKLGGRRTGAGRNLVFDTKKVIEFREKIKG